MKKKFLVMVVMIALVASFLTKQSAQANDNNTVLWPLPALSKDERVARFRFFMEYFDFEISDQIGKENKEQCNSLFSNFQDQDTFEVLTPAHGHFDMSSVETQKILSTCPAISLDTVYYKKGIGYLNFENYPDFFALSKNDKERTTDYYERATANSELYDFSAILGADVWGYFGEGSAPYCSSKQEHCERLTGYRKYSGVIGRVLDAKACKLLLDTPVKSGERIITVANKPYEYREKPSFFAFVQMDKEIYRTAIRVPHAWGDMEKFADPMTVSFYFEKVPAYPKDKTLKCTFLSSGLKSK